MQAKQAAYPEAYTMEAETIAQTMQQAPLPWDQDPREPGAASEIQPVPLQPASEPERRRSGILTAISMLPESAVEGRSSHGKEGAEAEAVLPGEFGDESAEGQPMDGEQGQHQLLRDLSSLRGADEMTDAGVLEVGGSATVEPARPGEMLASQAQAASWRSEDASAAGAPYLPIIGSAILACLSS